jgi:hypothetical protein
MGHSFNLIAEIYTGNCSAVVKVVHYIVLSIYAIKFIFIKHGLDTDNTFLAHLAFRPGELLSSLFVRPSTFHILIFSSETTGPIATKLWWNGPWMAPFQNCVR